ncbi:MAG TPA: phosphate regulon sensor histidine kinase PhoR [Chromatiales bacterium]|nr:phosphate regulon sensor histidine kinase PhoR [Chromatiales bacterium]
MPNDFWFKEVGRALLAGAAGAVLGWVLGVPAWGAALGLALLLGWHLRQLHDVLRWLSQGNRQAPKDLSGPWDALYGGIERLRRRGKKRKKKLSRLMRGFQKANAALPYGTVVLDADGQVEWFNQAAAQMLHLDSRRDRGRRITFLLRDPEFVRYLESGRYDAPVQIPAPRGSQGRLSIQAVKFGKHQILLTVRDVTREQALDAMRRDFVANVSHELRSPLTVLRGYLDMLDEETPSGRRQSVEEMRAQVERMARLVEDLLLLASLEAPEVQREEAAVDVGALVEQAVAAAQADTRAAHPFELDLDRSLFLQGVEHELESLVNNLIDNAVHYSPAGRPVCVHWGVEDACPVLRIEDQGVGIEPEHIPRLTERFYRADAGRSRESGGTGLGLAIVKHVLQRHGGELEIHSRPGEGSTFVCRFPAHRRIHAEDAPLPATGEVA